MLGTMVNVLAIVIGGSIGLILRKGIPDRLNDTVMKGLALCTFYIGVRGMLDGDKTLVLILSFAIGAIIGEALRLEDRIHKLAERLELRFSKAGTKMDIVPGFVTASLLFCTGAMTIVGSLQSGMLGNHDILFSKSMLDGIAALIFASSLGVGVLFSAIFVLVYQGALTFLASALAPVLTQAVIAEMTCVGSVLLIGLALNMLGVTKIRVMNYVPAIFLPILFSLFF